MKLALFGNYGATNLGDEAILDSILKNHSRHDWVVFSANPDETHHRHGIQAAPLFSLGIRSMLRFGLLRSLKALRSAEAVVFGGGGLFQDDRRLACFLWGWQVWWARQLRKPVFFYASGVGPLKTGLGRRIARWAYGSATGITVRDLESYETLVALGVEPANIRVAADPVFLFGVPPKPLLARKPHSLVISLRPWPPHDGRLIEILAPFLLKLKAEKGAVFTFVCMQRVREQDLDILRSLVEKVGGTLKAPQTFAEVIHLLESADAAIGMRYHFLIAALLAGTPALALGYSPKVESLYRGDLAPYHLPLEKLSPETLAQQWKRLSLDYNPFKVYARHRLEGLREKALKNMEGLEKFIQSLSA